MFGIFFLCNNRLNKQNLSTSINRLQDLLHTKFHENCCRMNELHTKDGMQGFWPSCRKEVPTTVLSSIHHTVLISSLI